MKINHIMSLRTFLVVMLIAFFSLLVVSLHSIHKNITIPLPVNEVILETSNVQKVNTTISRSVDKRDTIEDIINKVCSSYKGSMVTPDLVMSIIQRESEYNPKAKNGNCVGLMQVSTYWHSKRAEDLGVTDFYDPYSNILLGVDYLVELTDKNKSLELSLMLYSMKHDDAINLYNKGIITEYAKTILKNRDKYKKGV